jgi:DNA-binding transcriptional LysR family regulator
MQPYQLTYFVAVAEASSFTRAAQRIRVVQSAVSTAVRQLERELGCELFDRGHRGVTLTAEGIALLPRAREALVSLELARDAVNRARGRLSGSVTLGMMEYVGPVDLATLLSEFNSIHPDIVVKLRRTMAGSRSSIDEIRTGMLDLALVSTHTNELPGIELYDLHAESLVFVCPADHPLAKRDSVSILDIAGEDYIDFPLGWGNRTIVERAFEELGAYRTVRAEVTDFGLARTLVGKRLGVVILPSTAVPATGDVVAIRIVEDPVWHVRLAQPTGRPVTAAAARLAQHIRSFRFGDGEEAPGRVGATPAEDSAPSVRHDHYIHRVGQVKSQMRRPGSAGAVGSGTAAR